MARPRLTRPALALVLSLLGHGLAAHWLLSGPPQPALSPPPSPTFIEIAERPRPKPASIAAPQIPNRPAARAPVRAHAPHAQAQTVDASAAVAAAALPLDLDGTTGVPPASGEVGDVAEAVVPGGGSDGERAPQPADLDTARVHALLSQRAAHCYPPAAARLGLTGTTTVHFCVGAEHRSRDVSIRSGSGEPLLDRAVTDCVVGGATLPVPQDACFVVPVQFRAPP